MKTLTFIFSLILGVSVQFIPIEILLAQKTIGMNRNIDAARNPAIQENMPGNPTKYDFKMPDHDSLCINNINARVNASITQFCRYIPGAGFEVPKFSGKHTIFLSNLWIGGLDQNEELHLAAMRFGQGPIVMNAFSLTDYWVGPVMDSTAYSFYQDSLWDHVWNLRKSEIEYHQAHWNDPGYRPIQDILSWPGNGDISLGQASQLAPYFDRNVDGIYDPMDGDYPLIRGDQAIFFILNDDRDYHSESWGKKMKIEIHGMAYAFDIPEDSAFYNTIFLNYRIFNRSNNIYSNTYIGIYTDIDLGYCCDDYVGCDVERSMYYGYNGRSVDEGTSYPPVGTYGKFPPAQSVSIIGGPFMDPDGLDNPRFDGDGTQLCNESVNGINFGDTIVDNERLGMAKFVYYINAGPAYGDDPRYAQEYYQHLQGMWNDSTRMIYGGFGHISSGGYGPECNFMFPGESDTLNWGVGCIPPNGPVDWTETMAGSNPDDRRGLGSSGPFIFQPGAVQDFDIAYVFACEYDTIHGLGSVSKLRTYNDVIRKSFVSNILPNGNSFNGFAEGTSQRPISVQLFPNPASDKVYLRLDPSFTESLNIRIYNETGLLVLTKKTTPMEQMIAVDINGFSSGLYLILIQTKSQAVTKKLSIIR